MTTVISNFTPHKRLNLSKHILIRDFFGDPN